MTPAAVSLETRFTASPTASNDWLYIVVQEAVWTKLANRIGTDVGLPDLVERFLGLQRSASVGRNQQLMWTLINKFAEKHMKRELMEILNPLDAPCGPIMSLKISRQTSTCAAARCGWSWITPSAANGSTSVCPSSSPLHRLASNVLLCLENTHKRYWRACSAIPKTKSQA